MHLSDIIENLNLENLTPSIDTSAIIVKNGYTSDLLSDVIANAKPNSILITIQKHLNVLAVAKLKELSAILITNNIMPDNNTIQKANEENIVILKTDDNSFFASAKLYNLLKKNGDI